MARAVVGAGHLLHTSGGHRWPSPLISTPYSLPAGIESLREVVSFGLRSFVFPSELRRSLDERLPDGLKPERLVPSHRKPSHQPRSFSFLVVFQEKLSNPTMDRLKNWMGTPDTLEVIPVQKMDVPEWVSSDLTDQSAGYRSGTCSNEWTPFELMDRFTNETGVELPAVSRALKTDMNFSKTQ